MLRTQVASLRAANESLRALLEDKHAKITELEAKLARLERLITSDSGNSSMPPSGDDQPGKTLWGSNIRPACLTWAFTRRR